jgi:hypothetical protein
MEFRASSRNGAPLYTGIPMDTRGTRVTAMTYLLVLPIRAKVVDDDPARSQCELIPAHQVLAESCIEVQPPSRRPADGNVSRAALAKVFQFGDRTAAIHRSPNPRFLAESFDDPATDGLTPLVVVDEDDAVAGRRRKVEKASDFLIDGETPKSGSSNCA